MEEESPATVETPPTGSSGSGTFWRFTSELVKTVLIVVVLAYAIRHFLLQPFIVEGSSMAPRFATNDYLIIDKITYRFESPERGDVIVFKYPRQPEVNYVKRLIGLPGETVKLENGQVVIVNAAHPEGFTLSEPYLPAGLKTLPTYENRTVFTVPNDSYFVLGDNRPASSDSRDWGLLPKEDMIGRVLIQAFPTARAGFLGHPSY